MDENKQIEEMAEAVVGSAIVSNVEINNKVAINLNDFVKNMIRIGYRKQSDTVREFVQKLIYNITVNNTNDGYLSESIDYSGTIDDIKELAKEYSSEEERK